MDNRAAVHPFRSSTVNKLQQAPRCLDILDHSGELRDHRSEGTRSRRWKHQCGQKQQVTSLEKEHHMTFFFLGQQLHIYNDEFAKPSFAPFECFWCYTLFFMGDKCIFNAFRRVAEISAGARVQLSPLRARCPDWRSRSVSNPCC